MYRDDGLGAFNDSPRTIEKIKKEICKIFSEHKLKITIEANKKCVNFLDITFDLRTRAYKPYNKPDNIPQYVHLNSNHPPSIPENPWDNKSTFVKDFFERGSV